MSFIVVCIDKKNPELSEIVPVAETEEELLQGTFPPVDCMLFPTEQNAIRWTKEDAREYPDQYDYHIIEVN